MNIQRAILQSDIVVSSWIAGQSSTLTILYISLALQTYTDWPKQVNIIVWRPNALTEIWFERAFRGLISWSECGSAWLIAYSFWWRDWSVFLHMYAVVKVVFCIHRAVYKIIVNLVNLTNSTKKKKSHWDDLLWYNMRAYNFSIVLKSFIYQFVWNIWWPISSTDTFNML